VGVCSGVGSGVGVIDARGVFGLGVGVVATAVAGADFIGCASKTAFSRPYKEIRISMIEAPLISFRISLQFAKTPRHGTGSLWSSVIVLPPAVLSCWS
jgi:hypothetical protein